MTERVDGARLVDPDVARKFAMVDYLRAAKLKNKPFVSTLIADLRKFAKVAPGIEDEIELVAALLERIPSKETKQPDLLKLDGYSASIRDLEQEELLKIDDYREQAEPLKNGATVLELDTVHGCLRLNRQTRIAESPFKPGEKIRLSHLEQFLLELFIMTHPQSVVTNEVYQTTRFGLIKCDLYDAGFSVLLNQLRVKLGETEKLRIDGQGLIVRLNIGSYVLSRISSEDTLSEERSLFFSKNWRHLGFSRRQRASQT